MLDIEYISIYLNKNHSLKAHSDAIPNIGSSAFPVLSNSLHPQRNQCRRALRHISSLENMLKTSSSYEVSCPASSSRFLPIAEHGLCGRANIRYGIYFSKCILPSNSNRTDY